MELNMSLIYYVLIVTVMKQGVNWEVESALLRQALGTMLLHCSTSI